MCNHYVTIRDSFPTILFLSPRRQNGSFLPNKVSSTIVGYELECDFAPCIRGPRLLGIFRLAKSILFRLHLLTQPTIDTCTKRPPGENGTEKAGTKRNNGKKSSKKGRGMETQNKKLRGVFNSRGKKRSHTFDSRCGGNLHP